MSNSNFTVGKKYLDFEVTKSMPIKELHCQLIELTHIPTGAMVMHIANDDDENLFCLSFQTLPESSNGVAHILEHTVLCGSEKFPVKDPFFSMTRRSLNTFMNALTGSDFTCYPAATQVKKDFYNLLEVYLDAVFYPNLQEMSFLQEGHRLEFANADDPKTPLEYKGIVFNEMKGAMSSPTSRLHDVIYAALFPNLTYGVNSGGKPEEIPDLSYQELIEFHKKFYHPSRCLFFFYGNFPLEEHLEFIQKYVLDHTEKVAPLPSMPLQPRFHEPKRLTAYYPSSEEDAQDQTYISFTWLTGNIIDQEEILALCILELILMDTDASPLKLALLRSGLCTQATAYTDPEISEAPFDITLRGCKAENADKIEELLFSTLKALEKQGIHPDLIESAMHQQEIQRSEINGEYGPFGLTLFMRSALMKQHGAKAEDGLVIHTQFEHIHASLKENPRFFTDLMRKYLIDNKHFVRVVMIPDPNLGAKEIEEEKKTLEKIKASLSDDEKQQIIEQADELETFQEEQDDNELEILPKVSLEDVEKKCRDYPLEKKQFGDLTIYHHDCFTNSILYTDLIWKLPEIKEEDLWLLRLFCGITPQMGCGGRTYAENLEFIQANTGGLGLTLSLNVHAENFNDYTPTLHIKGKALYRKSDKLFTLMKDMATSVDFSDSSRLKEVIMKHYTSLQSSLTNKAMKYALSLSASTLNSACKIHNIWYGIDYFIKIRSIVQDLENALGPLTEKLYALKEQLLCLKGADLVLGCDADFYKELLSHNFYNLEKISNKDFKPWKKENTGNTLAQNQARIVSSPVAFTGCVFNTVSYVNEDSPALSVAAHLFDNMVLHRELREQGGAYGGGASCNTLSGNFLFYSYRDPQIFNSLGAFETAIEKMLNGEFNSLDLEAAKLEKIQSLDAPLSPGSRADLAYSWLIEKNTLEKRQAFRDRLLSLTKQEVIEAIEKHIAPNYKKGTVVVFAGKELLEKENKLFVEKKKEPLNIKSI